MALLLLVSVGVGGYLYWSGNQLREAHYQAGVRAMESGRWDVAVEELSIVGEFRDASWRLALAKEQLHRLEALYQRGLEHFQSGRWWEAAYYLRQAVEIDGEYQGSLALLEEARKRAGRMAAMRKNPEGLKDLLILNPDGGVQAIPIQGVDEVEDPKFSPDGNRFAFEAWQDHKGNLYLMDVNGGQPTLLAGDAEDAWINFSPDSRWALYGWSISGKWSLAVADIGNGERRGLASRTDYVWGDFSEDGGWVKVWEREGGLGSFPSRV